MGPKVFEPESSGRTLHALVLAGGSGRRLAGLTRRAFGRTVPKQYCRFGGERSLLQQTLERIAPVASGPRVTVVVDRSQSELAGEQLAPYEGVVPVEQPCDRDTAAGVLLPLLDLLRRAPDPDLLVTASDHGVRDDAAFLAAVATARRALAAEPGRMFLIGATPTAPNGDYGWIVRAGLQDGERAPDDVVRFVEKPPAEEAARLLASGQAAWNTMVLVARAQTLAAACRRGAPRLVSELTRLLAQAGDVVRLQAEEYARLPAVNFSSGILGTAADLGVVLLPAHAGWSDLGTEKRLIDWLERSDRVLAAQLAETA